MLTPRIEIDLEKIAFNTRHLITFFSLKGISIIAVTKAVNGNTRVAKTLVENGIKILADSRLVNIIKMRRAGIRAEYMLLRTPFLSQAKETVEFTDISLNSEISVIRMLSKFALILNKRHKIILMLELGDLREGIMPAEINRTVEQILKLKGVELFGIGVNLACFGGIKPTDKNMSYLTFITEKIESRFGLKLQLISGGNSANYEWFKNTEDTGRINNLRLGESILLGRETLYRKPIPKLFTDAFRLIAEVIEVKKKPSLPYGESGQNTQGNIPEFEDQGIMLRAILGIGLQDITVSGLSPIDDVEIVGASSDHLIINSKQLKLSVGKELSFDINYSALLSAMNSPHIIKKNKLIYDHKTVL